MALLDRRLDLIKDKILEETFIQGKGLGNELSFYIFDYDPKDELRVRDHIDYLINGYFTSEHYNRRIIEFDLFALFLEIAEEKNLLDRIFEMEAKQEKDLLYRALTTFAQPELFLEKIKKKMGDHNVLFITGVGKIYPIIRTHTILNNLQEVLEDKTPVILFFPGQYNEQDLQLFNKLQGDNYYRAFRLIDELKEHQL